MAWTNADVVRFHYTFELENGVTKTFDVKLNSETLELQVDRKSVPDWARLEYSQCEGCPLDPRKNRFCPIAANMSGLVEFFGDVLSCEKAHVIVETPERTYSKRTLVQDGLFSMLGIYMTTSGCPILDKLRPLTRTHLPFSTIDETIYRVVTMYLTAQYYRMRKGLAADWEFKKLIELYEAIKKVNIGLVSRLRAAARQESLLNAVVILDVFATNFQVLADKSVDSLEYLFAPYLEEKNGPPSPSQSLR